MEITSKKKECHGIVYWKIKHKKYKLMLAKQYQVQTKLRPKKRIENKYFILTKSGLLIIKRYYCWNGANFPAITDDKNRRGSLIHDLMYQLLTMKLYPKKTLIDHSLISTRKYADDLLYDIIRADGMGSFRAHYYWIGVRAAGWAFI